MNARGLVDTGALLHSKRRARRFFRGLNLVRGSVSSLPVRPTSVPTRRRLDRLRDDFWLAVSG